MNETNMSPFLVEAWAEFLASIHALVESNIDYIVASSQEFEWAKENRGRRLDRARAAFHRLELLESEPELMKLASRAYWYPHYPDLDYFRLDLAEYFKQVDRLEPKQIIGETLCCESVELVSLLGKKLRHRQGFKEFDFPVWDDKLVAKHAKQAKAMLQDVIEKKKSKKKHRS